MSDKPASPARGRKKTAPPAQQPPQEEVVVRLPLADLYPFPDHPFQVRDDEEMRETIQSVKEYGVIVPAIVRPREEGGYEIVAGHRRKYACEQAGLDTMPVLIRNLDRDAATIIMVDSNLQRENILPSERAKAYKMKLEAIKRQGARNDLTSPKISAKLRSDDEIGQQMGVSGDTVRNYISLTNLVPELMQMYVMITLSLNLMVGYMGQMSFGHAAFMGIGAYTAAILTTTYDVPFFVAFILAGVVAGLFGLLLGLPVLKLKGYYFTIITMVFCEIVRVVELNWMSLTRGPLGIMAIPKPSFLGFEITTPRQFYFMILVLVALSTLVVSNLMKSRVGYAILAIRDDELAAEAMGIHVFRYKMIVFILSSLLVGLAGAFYATYTSYIDPSSFAAAQSNDMLVMVIFGGLGNTVGSFIGAISLSILPEALRDLAQYRQLIYGVLLVLLMMVKPQGLLGDINFKYIRQRMEHREKSKEAANE